MMMTIMMMVKVMRTGEAEVGGQIREENGAMNRKRLTRDLKGEMREIVDEGEMVRNRDTMRIQEDVIAVTEVREMKTTGDGIWIEGPIVSKRQG